MHHIPAEAEALLCEGGMAGVSVLQETVPAMAVVHTVSVSAGRSFWQRCHSSRGAGQQAAAPAEAASAGRRGGAAQSSGCQAQAAGETC